MSLSKKVRGFTLIELMIVVAIIGILAAVAIPKFADLVTKSKEASVKGTLGSIRSAVSIYYGDNDGTYPANLFTSLTTANKYVPGVAGIASLGKYDIPHVNSTNNPGHSVGLYLNASDQAAVVQGDLSAIGDGAPLFFVNTNNSLGEVYIDCSHLDTKSSRWTSY